MTNEAKESAGEACLCPLCGAKREKRKDHRWTKGLSVRAANALVRDGFNSKNEIRVLLEEKTLLWIPEVGKKLEAEILSWLDA